MRIHYATQLYRQADSAVHERVLRSIMGNLEITRIVSATLFLDDCTCPIENSKLNAVELNRRAEFSDFLALASPEAVQADTLLFANSDILFDQSVERLACQMKSTGSVACLTRRELSGNFPAGLEPLQSQDAWMLRFHNIDQLLLGQLKGIQLGRAGCEHVFAAAMLAHGYSLWNPCLDVTALHNDPNPAAYAPDCERYWGLYAYIPECRLADVESCRPDVGLAYALKPGHYLPVSIG